MSIYEKKIFPALMKMNIGKEEILDLRRALLKESFGEILEIGIGLGINLPLYPKSISNITAIDSYIRTLPTTDISVSLYNNDVTNMHFDSNSFDTVISTFTLCSVKDLDQSLSEIKRVLKPKGKLLFLEHGQAPYASVQNLQNLFNPLYNIFAYGCNINRNYKMNILNAGFSIEKYEIKKASINPKILTGYIHTGGAIND